MKKIKVQLDFNIASKIHSLYYSFFNNPPEGIEYSKSEFSGINKKTYSKLGKLRKSIIKIFPYFEKIQPKIISLLRKEKKSDLIHFTFHLGDTNKICVADYESSYSFITKKEIKNKKIGKIINKLNKSNLKCLMPIHYEAYKSFKIIFGDKVKIPQEVVYPTIFVPEKNRSLVKKKNKVIFISTANIKHNTIFQIKGGLETLKAFERLSKKYPNWEFIILGKIPSYLKEKFPKNLILKDEIPREEMWKMFNESKIFVQPCYQTPAMAYLEAMWFKLPIVTYDVWANKEYVDNKNGILIRPENPKHIGKDNVPEYTSKVIKSIEKNSEKNSEKIIYAIEKLIKDEKLRKKLGKKGFEKILQGKFSIEKRNKQLRKIYEEALKT